MLIYSLGCTNDTRLKPPCGLRCSSFDKKNQYRRNLGECQDGVWVCNESGQLSHCEGEIKPAWERCDGLDNDCDGHVDDMSHPHAMALADIECNNRGVCDDAWVVCVDGNLFCRYPEHAELDGETLCDGLDNDCDGRVDEDIQAGYCYTGPIGTEHNPPCHPGVLECSLGELICRNQFTPTPELCDGIDNDCDGLTDNAGEEANNYDLVFVIDTSGSMQPYINAIVSAVDAYAGTFLGENAVRFAIVTINGPAPNRVSVALDFTDMQTFRNVLLQLRADGGGAEDSIGGIYAVCNVANNPIGLGWRPGVVGVLFELTDERAQNYTGVTMQETIDTCLTNGVLPVVWSRFEDQLKTIAEGANGLYFSLSSDWQMLYNQMESVVIRLCHE